MTTRQTKFDKLRANPKVSILVIGGGINGIGTFRDLALQGVDVLLIEKGDYCSGSSAASTRQAHGGLRYLEHGEFRLVRESLLERNRLLTNAPHAVELLKTTIPIYKRFSGILNAPLKFIGLLQKPSERGYLVVKLGMMMYDWFTRNNRVTPTHKMLGREQALAEHAQLNPDIIGAATYYDCLMPQAERIAVELVLDAEAAFDEARALNYCSVISATGDSVQIKDELSGEVFSVQPKLVINAGGAWIDFVNRSMQHPTRFIGGTKGSHIVVDNPELLKTLNGSALYFENKDGRLGIIEPFRDKVIIGATDIRADDPDSVVCTDEEIDYFMQFWAQVLPGITVERSQIVFTFCGVRPLPASDVEFVGLVSRDHSLRVVEPDANVRFPIYSLIGGKWTTFRAFAEQVTDKALAFLGKSRRTATEDIAIGGGKDYPRTDSARDLWLKQVQSSNGITAERLQTLFERYGTRAQAIAQFIMAEPDVPLRHQPTYSQREIIFLTANESVIHLDDLILRRSLIGMLGLIDGDVLQQLAKIVGGVLGWSAAQTQAEIDRTTDILQTKHGVPAARLKVTT
ncbi:MAG: glycerol-3-phosphate dehydrogenase/oxidase [Anaerolineae bacterium]|nr:glycerol-3-phosphate dehydrogenase/oxidase [Anaerolineae bacterium]